MNEDDSRTFRSELLLSEDPAEQVDFDYDKLVAEYQRLSRQWSSELSDVNRLRIDRRMKEIELLLEVS